MINLCATERPRAAAPSCRCAGIVGLPDGASLLPTIALAPRTTGTDRVSVRVTAANCRTGGRQ